MLCGEKFFFAALHSNFSLRSPRSLRLIFYFLGDDPLALLGEEVDQEVAAQVVGGGVEGPAPVDLGDLLDKLHQRGILPEHEDVQLNAAGRAFLELLQGLGQGLGVGRKLEEDFPVLHVGGRLSVGDHDDLLVRAHVPGGEGIWPG